MASTVEGDELRLGFVPTMGALHAGHRALIEEAVAQCDKVVVSIFVNPTQFGPGEDFEKYPRTLEADIDFCESAGADCIFYPSVEELYPNRGDGPDAEQSFTVRPPAQLINKLCGVFRPGHFEGVATIVAKLFNIINPHSAFFGEKDYQQLIVVKRMVRDLNLEIDVQGVHTVRERDGLAMSSRNKYLDKDQRKTAARLNEVLDEVRRAVFDRGIPIEVAIADGVKNLTGNYGFRVQYLEACDAETLEVLDRKRGPMVFLVAALLGDVRLIDNVIVR